MNPRERFKLYSQAKIDPALAIIKYLERSSVKDMTKEWGQEMAVQLQKLKDKIPSIAKEISQELRNEVYRNPKMFFVGPQFTGPQGEKGEKGESIKGEKGEKGNSGYSPVPGVDYPSQKEVEKMIVSLFPKELVQKLIEASITSTPTAEKLARGFEKLEGKERLDYFALKNLPYIPQAPKKSGMLKGGGGGGGGLSFEVPVGTVNDNNTTFTVSNTPLFIIVNGPIYTAGTGIFTSYAGGTISLSTPVGTGGFIISVYS